MNFDFSETIREFRKKEDFTQKELGNMCGVSAATVCRCEKGIITKSTRKIVSKIVSYQVRKRMLSSYAEAYALVDNEKTGEPIYLHSYDTKNSLWDKIKRFIRKVLF